MESGQSMPGFDGTQVVANRAYNAAATSSRPVRLTGYILRGVVILLTFISAIVIGSAKEDVTYIVQNDNSIGTSSFHVLIKSTYSAAYVYFIVANVLVFFYTLISLVISLANRSGSSIMQLPLNIADILMVVLLFSSNGAAIAIDIVAEHGQSHFGWAKFCDDFYKFCSRITASIVLSMIASLAYTILIILTMIGLHKKSQ
ncbi:CASP-like protein 1E1 [Elaeis guineensis]|uniref:CASP-like protein n=1 Tax=Elaeis guineensis var. tenera TaxID=51953 RepID=A0A2S1VVQ2_ELAGV|nr:CASP-like protein 1E1 isoform X1 [Elaeis guineensis]AWJ58410.1 casp-like protein [Elaeis guineensis]